MTARVRPHRRLLVLVRGGSSSRVALTLVRGRKTVARRTVAPRDGVARATFRLRRAGRYRVLARTTGGLRLTGRSSLKRVR